MSTIAELFGDEMSDIKQRVKVTTRSPFIRPTYTIITQSIYSLRKKLKNIVQMKISGSSRDQYTFLKRAINLRRLR